MNFHNECEEFDVKPEEDPLFGTEIKTEPQEIKTETEESDNLFEHLIIKNENESISQLVASTTKTESEVKGTEERLDKLLQDYKKKLKDEQSNVEGDRTDVPVVPDIYRNILHEQKCVNYTEDNENIRIITSNSKPNIYTQTEERCNTSHKPFFDKSSLITHFLCSTNEKHFICNICTKSFPKKYHLDRHVRTHTNEKPFKCNNCDKQFSDKSTLIRHAHNHMNEKPFKCNICSKSFSDKTTLTLHTRIHTNEKPFTCNTCNKSFAQKSSLTRHTHTHTNEKPFKCDNCIKSFSDKFALTKHTRTHINELPFKSNISIVTLAGTFLQ